MNRLNGHVSTWGMIGGDEPKSAAVILEFYKFRHVIVCQFKVVCIFNRNNYKMNENGSDYNKNSTCLLHQKSK